MQARMAAENARLGKNDLIKWGVHLTEAEMNEQDEHGSIVDIEGMGTTEPEAIIDVDEITMESGNLEADSEYEDELSDHEGVLTVPDHKGVSTDQITELAKNRIRDSQPTVHMSQTWRMRVICQDGQNKKVSLRLDGFQHSMFTMYNREGTWQRLMSAHMRCAWKIDAMKWSHT